MPFVCIGANVNVNVMGIRKVVPMETWPTGSVVIRGVLFLARGAPFEDNHKLYPPNHTGSSSLPLPTL